jgi:hypothetical protein
MPENEQQKPIAKTHWFEKNERGEWFVCFTKPVHGKKRVIKLAVKEINEKIKRL